MNLAGNKVKNSVDLRSARNGTILKNSIAIKVLRTQEKSREVEIISSCLRVLCFLQRSRSQMVPA